MIPPNPQNPDSVDSVEWYNGRMFDREIREDGLWSFGPPESRDPGSVPALADRVVVCPFVAPHHPADHVADRFEVRLHGDHFPDGVQVVCECAAVYKDLETAERVGNFALDLWVQHGMGWFAQRTNADSSQLFVDCSADRQHLGCHR